MDTAHWHQSMEGIEGGVKLGQNGGGDHHHHQQKKAKPQEQLNCPRCNSTNTKFCYYNNYSLTQPRYFCKTCRRYWTEGGSLRNVPVGGGSRKNKKSISSSPTTAMTTTSSSSSILSKLNSSNNSNSNSHHDHDPVNPSSVLVVPNLSQFSFQNTKIMDEGGASQDLNLAFQYVHQHASKMELDHNHMNMNQQSGGMTSSTSALELLRSGMASRGLNNSFIPNLIPDSSSTTTTTTSTSAIFSSPGFSLDFHHHGLNGSSRYHNEMQESNHGDHYHNGKILFPFPEAKQQINPNISTSSDQATHQNSRGSDEGGANSNGYWSGLLGGSGSW